MKHFFYLFIFLLPVLANSQDKTVSIALERNEELLDMLDLKEEGIIVKTGKDYANTKALSWRLHYYTSELEKLWEVPIEKKQINKGFKNWMIYSPGGEYIYHFEPKGYNTHFAISKYAITQISKEGKKKEKELKELKKKGEKFATVATEKHLCFFAIDPSINYNRSKDKKKLMMYRYDHETLREKRILVQTPFFEKPKKWSYWQYKGFNDEGFFLASKKTDGKMNTIAYRIAIVNEDGKLVREFTIDFELGKGRYLRPTMISDDVLFANIHWRFLVATLGNIVFDFEENVCYLHGLSGRKENEKGGEIGFNGLFLRKYDLEGEELLRMDPPRSKKLPLDHFFSQKSFPPNRFSSLVIESDKSLRFHVSFANRVFTAEFDKEGTYLGKMDCKFKGLGKKGICHLDLKNFEGFQFLQSRADNKKFKKHKYYLFDSMKGEILIETQAQKKLLNLYYFE